MDGKAAMLPALARPKLMDWLFFTDLAPVGYRHDQTEHATTMRRVDLSQVAKLSDATNQLTAYVSDPILQKFFTH